MWDFDDDNELLACGPPLHQSGLSSSAHGGMVSARLLAPDESPTFNPYPMMGAPHSPVWPRGLPLERVVVGGFSQGAMTAMDLALAVPSAEGRVGGVVMLSGGPIVVDQWHAALQQPHMKGLRVLQTHGLNDQTLPFPVSQWAKQVLETRANHNFVQHSGGHELGGMSVIGAIRDFVSAAKK